MTDFNSLLVDFGDPRGVLSSIAAGWHLGPLSTTEFWTIAGSEEPLRDTAAGPMPTKATFRVQYPNGTETRLLLAISDRTPTVECAGVLSLGRGQADEALAELTSLQSMSWWLKRALLLLALPTIANVSAREAWPTLVRAVRTPTRRRNNRVDEALLQRVASIYLGADPGTNPTAAVQASIHTSRTNAYRLVAQARKAGLLEPLPTPKENDR